MIRFDIITIFPKIFDSYFGESILARARKKKLIQIKVHNLRDYTADKHKTVDDSPYGGGAGMVLMAEPILRVVDQLISSSVRQFKNKKLANKQTSKLKTKIVVFSAKGKLFNQKTAYDWSRTLDQIILICGRYEGIDERVVKILKAEEISVGPYVLTDGEVPAMAVVSAVARLIPGVIRLESLAEESHWNLLLKKEALRRFQQVQRKQAQGKGRWGLEYPHYTRPEIIEYKGKKYKVPPVLLSGDHKKIAAWRESRRSV